MASFRYKAVTPAGETVEGRMDAASADDVIARLQEQGNVPLEASDAAGGGSLFGRLRRKTLSGAALVEFTEQLGILLHAGLPLDRALQMLLELPEGERARHVVERIRDRVRGGVALSRAMEEEHGVFSKLLCRFHNRPGVMGVADRQSTRRCQMACEGPFDTFEWIACRQLP